MVKFIFIFFIFCIVPCLNQTTQNYIIDSTRSSVSFTAHHLGRSEVNGEFNKFSGEIRLKSNQLVSITGRLYVDSIDTNNKIRDKYLKSKKFLNSDKYPIITFISNSFNSTSNRLVSSGVLMIHGVSQNISLDLSMDQYEGTLHIQTDHIINRFDYNLLQHKRMISPTVNISLDIFSTIH